MGCSIQSYFAISVSDEHSLDNPLVFYFKEKLFISLDFPSSSVVMFVC